MQDVDMDGALEGEDFVSSFLTDDYRDNVDFTGGQRRSFLDHSIDSIVSMGAIFLPSWEIKEEEEEVYDEDEESSNAPASKYSRQTPPFAAHPPVMIKQEPGLFESKFSPVQYLQSLIPAPAYPPPPYEQTSCPSPNHEFKSSELDITIHEQPAVEVRTRTPSENRTFSVAVTVQGDWQAHEISSVRASLVYASTEPGEAGPSQSILGGTKTVRVSSDGRAVFDNLCMSEASTRHKEKEFKLEFTLIRSDGRPTGIARLSRAFYAYSHKRVLSRRRNIKLRTLNKSFGSMQGGEAMHAIGLPFINGPSLRVIFRTPHGDAAATQIELFSESVLFFRLPAYPAPSVASSLPDGTEVKVTVVLTNDGKTFSNPLDFTYVAGAPRSRY